MRDMSCPEFVTIAEVDDESMPTNAAAQYSPYRITCSVMGEHEVHTGTVMLRPVAQRRPNATMTTVLSVRW